MHITKVQISGVTCNACQKVISKRLKTIGDIQEVHVQLENGNTTILASRPILNDEVNQALVGTHYKVIVNL